MFDEHSGCEKGFRVEVLNGGTEIRFTGGRGLNKRTATLRGSKTEYMAFDAAPHVVDPIRGKVVKSCMSDLSDSCHQEFQCRLCHFDPRCLGSTFTVPVNPKLVNEVQTRSKLGNTSTETPTESEWKPWEG